jgi:quercetin dioxygenase-like cupin family protein
VHHPDQLPWQKVGDIPRPDSIQLDDSELGCVVAYHERGSADSMELLEMRFEPDTVLVPHSHDSDEIIFVVEGSITYGHETLVAGCSIYIPGGAFSGGHTGSEPTRLLSFRARADFTWKPMTPAPS